MSHRQRQARRRRGRPNTGNRVALGLGVLATLASIGAFGVVGYVVAIAGSAPALENLKAINKGTSSVIYAADGSRLGYVQSDVIRTPIPWRAIPEVVRNATVAIEDRRFYAHRGVDYEAIVRAGVKNVRSGRTVQGGSTITQQLVRALYIKDPKRNFERKIREAKLASELESKHDKRWILREYLNAVPYGTTVGGRTALGVEAAASTFFAKHARDLTLEQAALLAGLPQAPSNFNPFRNPTAALERRNEVIKRMVDEGYVSAARAATAYAADLGLRPGSRYTKRREPYFFDYVQDQLIQHYGVGVFRRGGLKIHTTIDPKLQDAARSAVLAQLNQPDDPSAAVVAIDPSNGYIRAMASSGSYKDRSFNLAAQGHRQPGSAFKTMVLTTAVRRGVNPRTTSYRSMPLKLNVPGYGPWEVKTYKEDYPGQMDLVRATLRSDNSVYAQLDLDLGPKSVAETARLMGIKTKLDGLPSEGLGGLRLGVSPLEMANAYATLASGGMRNEPKAITRVDFPDGKSDDLGEPQRTRAFIDGVASEVTKILEQNVEAGTGTAAKIDCPAAGKTGTTDNFNDAWFVGYTPRLSTSVWVGYPNALREMRGVHGIDVAGGTFPARIWHDFMVVAKGSDCDPFAPPTQPVTFTPFTGQLTKTLINRASGAGQNGVSPGADNSAGGKDYKGYDPRLYDEPAKDGAKQPTGAQPGNDETPGKGPSGGTGAPPSSGT